ncbi:MAG TPA: wax ester/triacylglycerol synthase domain-containing protein [Candidatus Limnocylindrales bacterium]|nr:wax ester/triacylglycerol synthase domain-containing protein [Candidatus Limnocylindrales bacterium]
MRLERLGTVDRLNLAIEIPGHPMNMGAVALVDAADLLDGDGCLPLAALRERISTRLPKVPRLRQVVKSSRTLSGRPLWRDDPGFRIGYHINRIKLAPPADEQGLLRLAADLMSTVLDRRHPLWRMWFITGIAGGQAAVILVLHHVVADGLGAMKLLTALFGNSSVPQMSLARDTARPRTRRIIEALTGAVETFRHSRKAPRTTFNRPVGTSRSLAVLRLDLATAKQVAHHHGGKVNDVVLAMAAAALRDLMLARGELTGQVCLHAAVAVSLRDGGDLATAAGNRTGGYVVHLPISISDSATRLRLISADSAYAKRTQSPVAGNMFLVLLARLGLIRRLSRRQRFTNLVESNIAGPAGPISLLGVPVRELIPIGVLAGNLSIAFLALSYAGCLVITVQADTDLFDDLTLITDAAQREWDALRRIVRVPTKAM